MITELGPFTSLSLDSKGEVGLKVELQLAVVGSLLEFIFFTHMWLIRFTRHEFLPI